MNWKAFRHPMMLFIYAVAVLSLATPARSQDIASPSLIAQGWHWVTGKVAEVAGWLIVQEETHH